MYNDVKNFLKGKNEDYDKEIELINNQDDEQYSIDNQEQES